MIYITRQDECWDEVARAVYGSEKHTGYLMQSNLPLLDIAVFSAGIRVNVPVLPEKEEGLPPWMRQV